MRSLLAVVLVVCAAHAAAFADELTADEKKWLKQCVEGLKSPSDRVMAGAEDAIVRLGKDALPSLVPLLGSLDPLDDFDWAAAGRALAGIGARDSADAIDAARAKWPKPSQARLAALVTDLRAGKLGPRAPAPRAASAGGGAPPPQDAPPVDDAAVAAQVNAILETYADRHSMSSRDPEIRRIVAFGHAAVAPLLRWLTGNVHGHSMANNAAQQALDDVAIEADIPDVAKALEAGALEAASCLKKFRTPAARDVLLGVVRRGFMAHEVLEGLEPHSSDAAVRKALVDWLQAHGTAMSWDVGAVARFLGERNVAEALPALQPLAKLGGEALPQVATALATLGDKEGIAALVSFFENAAGSQREYERHEAGEALNRIIGQAWYVGKFGPPGMGGGPQGNFDEAAKKFREWWTANAEKLEFDATARRWRVK